MVNAVIKEIINVVVDKQTGGLTLSDFDTTGVLTNDIPLSGFTSNVTKDYNLASEVTTDFGAGSDTEKAVGAIFKQEPKPLKAKVIIRQPAIASGKFIKFSVALIADNLITAQINGETITQIFDSSTENTVKLFADQVQAVKGINIVVLTDENGAFAGDTVLIKADLEFPLSVSGVTVSGGVGQPTVTTGNMSVMKEILFDAPLVTGNNINGTITINDVVYPVDIDFLTSDTITLDLFATRLAEIVTADGNLDFSERMYSQGSRFSLKAVNNNTTTIAISLIVENGASQPVITSRTLRPQLTLLFDIDFVTLNQIDFDVETRLSTGAASDHITVTFLTDQATTIDLIIADLLLIPGIDEAVKDIADSNTRSIVIVADDDTGVTLENIVVSLGAATPVGTQDLITNMNFLDAAPRAAFQDLAAGIAESNGFYFYGSTSSNAGVLRSLGENADTLRKFGGSHSREAGIILDSSTDDILSELKAKNIERFSLCYPKILDEFLHFGAFGMFGGFRAGLIVAGVNAINGITANTTLDLTSSERNAILSKNGNVYLDDGSTGVFRDGKAVNGTFWDIVRDVDVMVENLVNDLYLFLKENKKTPFTTLGIGQVSNVISSSLNRRADEGIILTPANDPNFVLLMPEIANISQNDKANRILKNISIRVTLQGAIQFIQPINLIVLV